MPQRKTPMKFGSAFPSGGPGASMPMNPFPVDTTTLQDLLGQFGVGLPKMRQNIVFPETGFFGQHPALTRGIENSLLAVAGMPGTGPVAGAGENIQSAIQGFLGVEPARRQFEMNQMMAPLQMAGQVADFRKILSGLESDKTSRELQQAQAEFYRTRPDIAMERVSATRPVPVEGLGTWLYDHEKGWTLDTKTVPPVRRSPGAGTLSERLAGLHDMADELASAGNIKGANALRSHARLVENIESRIAGNKLASQMNVRQMFGTLFDERAIKQYQLEESALNREEGNLDKSIGGIISQYSDTPDPEYLKKKQDLAVRRDQLVEKHFGKAIRGLMGPTAMPAASATSEGSPIPSPSGKQLTVEQAKEYLRKSGGDRKKAEAAARAEGWEF